MAQGEIDLDKLSGMWYNLRVGSREGACMTKLTELVTDLAILCEAELDFPLEAKAPSKAIAPVVVPMWNRREIAQDRIEPIPLREPEIAKAEPQGRPDYMQAAQAANRLTRKARRRAIGREEVSEIAKATLVEGIVGNLRRKDKA